MNDFRKVVGVDIDKIDYSIRELIYILNKKNYKTTSCCSGIQSEHYHYVDRMYVVFKHPYDLPSFPEEIDNIEIDDKGFLYIDFVGEDDNVIKRVIKQWTEWANNLSVHKEEVRLYCYSIIVETRNGRQLFIDTSYDKTKIFNKMKKLKDSKRYRSIKLKRSALERW